MCSLFYATIQPRAQTLSEISLCAREALQQDASAAAGEQVINQPGNIMFLHSNQTS